MYFTNTSQPYSYISCPRVTVIANSDELCHACTHATVFNNLLTAVIAALPDEPDAELNDWMTLPLNLFWLLLLCHIGSALTSVSANGVCEW